MYRSPAGPGISGPEKQHLRYGEKLILTNTQHGVYLGCRGTEYQATYFAKFKRPNLASLYFLYPNLDEIVFEIHPNLNYESLLEYNECSHNDPNKEIFYKRMILEQNLNVAKIEENRGKHVKLGSLVQLYHPNSRSYLSFESQNISGCEMGVLGSSAENSESVQFLITSPYDFLKEGSLVSCDEKFVFSDRYNKTLAFPLSEAILEKTKLKLEVKVSRGIMGFFDSTKPKEFRIAGILESQKLFEGYPAGYINEKSVGAEYCNQFEAISVEAQYSSGGDGILTGQTNTVSNAKPRESDIIWGDSVNIRRVDSTGKYSLVFAEVNQTSYKDAVLYRTFSSDQAGKASNLESQFQLVSPNLKSSGSKIKFDKFGSAPVLLKHVLSGKFLCIDPQTQKVVLGGDFEEEFERIKSNKSRLEREYQDRYSTYARLKESKKSEEISKRDGQSFTQREIDMFQNHGSTLFQSEEDYFLVYVMLRTFVLEKVSSDESPSLNNSTFVRIRTFEAKHLSVMADPEYLKRLQIVSKEKEESEVFEPTFYKQMEQKLVHDSLSQQGGGDIFHFEKTEKELLRRFYRLNSYTPLLCQIQCTTDLKQFLTFQYTRVVESITDIARALISLKKVSKYGVQLMLIQISAVDLLMQYLIKVRSSTRESEEHMALLVDSCDATLRLLSLVCDSNPTACSYVFQWRKFFIVSIIKTENPVFKRINVDSLLFQIVDILKCYSIYIDDYLGALCSSMKAENQDEKKLGILLQITKNFQNLKDGVSVSRVFEKIFDPRHKEEIFRKLKAMDDDPSKIYFSLSPSTHIDIDETLAENIQAYSYFLKILNLVVNLGELDPAKTAKHLQQVYPKDVCITLITDPRFPSELRAMFLRLFALLYIIPHFHNGGRLSFEELVATQSSMKPELARQMSDTSKALDKLRDAEENKSFLNSLLGNLNNSDNELALASLKVFNMLIDYQFFETDEILVIKSNFEDMILSNRDAQILKEKDKTKRSDTEREFLKEQDTLRLQRVVSEFDPKQEPVAHGSDDFKFQDPETMIEIVDMLIKLHRSLLRSKIVSLIRENRGNKTKVTLPSNLESGKKSIDQLIKEHFDVSISGYLDGLAARNQQIWEVISHWVLHKNPALSAKVISFIHESSLMKYFFLEKYAEFHQVEDKEDELIYLRLRKYLRSFSSKMQEIMAEYTAVDYNTLRGQTDKLVEDLRDLTKFFYHIMEFNDRENKFELGVKEFKFYKPKDIVNLDSKPVWMNLLNIFLLDCQRLKSKQSIILKSGLLDMVMNLVISFSQQIFQQYPKLAEERIHIEGLFKIIPEYATAEPLSDEIKMMALLILYAAVVGNPTASTYLMEKYESELLQILLTNLNGRNFVLKKVTLTLIVEIYKDNLGNLLRLRQKTKPQFVELLKITKSEIQKKSYSILVNYIELFDVLSHFNGALLEENAKDIFNSLFSDNLEGGLTITELINQGTLEDITSNYSSISQAQKFDFSQTKKGKIFNQDHVDLDEMDEKNNIYFGFEISDKLMFISSLVGLIARFGRKGSLEFKSKMQKKLSMNSLVDLISASKFHFYLKSQLVDLLNHVFITAKIDQNSKSYLLELVSGILIEDMKSYFQTKSSNLTSKELFFINKTPRVNFICLDSNQKAPAMNNHLCREQSQLFVEYSCLSLIPLVRKLGQILGEDSDSNLIILEEIMGSLEEAVREKDLLSDMYDGDKLMLSSIQGSRHQELRRFTKVEIGSSGKKRVGVYTPRKSKSGRNPEKQQREEVAWSGSQKIRSRKKLDLIVPEMDGRQEEFEDVGEFLVEFNNKLEELEMYFGAEVLVNCQRLHELRSFNLLLVAEHKSVVQELLWRRDHHGSTKVKLDYLRTHSSKLAGVVSKMSSPSAADHFLELEIQSSKSAIFFDELTTLMLLRKKTESKNTKSRADKQLNSSVRKGGLKIKLEKREPRPEIRFNLSRSISQPVSANQQMPQVENNSNIVPNNPNTVLETPSGQTPANTTKDLRKHIHLQSSEELDRPADQKRQGGLDVTGLPLLTEKEKQLRAKIVNGDLFTYRGKQHSLNSDTASAFQDAKHFRSFVCQIIDSLQMAPGLSGSHQTMLAVEYLSYLVDHEFYRHLLMKDFQEHLLLRSLLQLLVNSQADISLETTVTLYSLINKLLKFDPEGPQLFYQELLRDFENKIIMNYFAALEYLFRGLLELEAINTQSKFFETDSPESGAAQDIEVQELIKSYVKSAAPNSERKSDTQRGYLTVPPGPKVLKSIFNGNESVRRFSRDSIKFNPEMDVAQEGANTDFLAPGKRVLESQILTSEQAQDDIFADAQQFSNLQHLLCQHKQSEVSLQIAKHTEMLVELLQLTQLLCQTHDLPIQEFLRLQTVNGVARPLQVNIFERLRDLMKGYLKIVKGRNLSIITNILTTLRHLVIGPCHENQKEIIVRKVSAVLEELYALLYQVHEVEYEADKSRAILAYLKLKLAMVEGTQDGLILRTLSISLNPDLLWTRIEQVYCFLHGLKSTSMISVKRVAPAIGILTESPTMSPVKKPQANNKKFIIKKGMFDGFQLKLTEPAKSLWDKFQTWFKESCKKLWPESKPKAELADGKLYQGNDYSVYVQEALYTMIWMSQLSELVPEVTSKIERGFESTKKTSKYLNKAAAFVKNKIRSIEVFGHTGDKLETTYFYLHPIVGHLSHYSKRKFETEVNRKTAMTKLWGLISWIELFYFEMRHFDSLARMGVKGNLSYITRLKLVSFILAVLVNILMMVNSTLLDPEQLVKDRQGKLDLQSGSETLQTIVYIASWVLFVLYLLILTLWFFFEFSVKRLRFAKDADYLFEVEWREYKKNARTLGRKFWKKGPFLILKRQCRIWFALVTRTNVTVIFFYLLMSFLSLVVSRFFLSLLLLDVISLSPLLKNVVKSLGLNYKSLGGTAVLAIVLLFIYSSFTYFQKDVLITNLGVQDQPNIEFCPTFWICFVDMITFGLRTGGGIGMALEYPDNLKQPNQYIMRTFFDLIFFVTVDLMLLNIVLGIIIDSFSELRDLKDLMGKFLCSS